MHFVDGLLCGHQDIFAQHIHNPFMTQNRKSNEAINPDLETCPGINAFDEVELQA